MTTPYDAIVVGARCAGSPTAMLLARKGYRVLLVDRVKFPSDTISTHLLHPVGVDALARWGLLDQLIATGCPPIRQYRIDFDGPVLAGAPGGRADSPAVAYGPRRIVLDQLLLDAAREAGVEVREQYTVEEIIRDADGRVTGIRGRGPGAESAIETARVVVGADGRRSMVARTVDAVEYHQKPIYTAGYYAYWSGLPVDEFRVYVRPHSAVVMVPTHDGQCLVLVGWPRREFAANKLDLEGSYRRGLDLPELTGLFAGATRETRLVGTGDMLNAFRVPFGPGWALVGDAGYVKDPCTAHGISDSFMAAELLSTALDDAFSGRVEYAKALGGYQAARDKASKGMYDFTLRLAPMDPLPGPMRFLFDSMTANQPAMDRFAGMFGGTVPINSFFTPRNLLGILAYRFRHGTRRNGQETVVPAAAVAAGE